MASVATCDPLWSTRDYSSKKEFALLFPFCSFLCAIFVVFTEDLINFEEIFILYIRIEYLFILNFALKVIFQDKSPCN